MLDRQSMQVAAREVRSADPAVVSAAIVSHDGLVMVAEGGDRDAAELLAAMVSEILSKGKQAIREVSLGGFHGQIVFGTTGGVMVRRINDEMVLVAQFAPGVNVGALYGRLNRIAAGLGED
jgi:predicted regulator of Ras-like GTPase activity (Roadblock/LC7/MglB family)